MADTNTKLYYDANIFLSFLKEEKNDVSVDFLFEAVILNKFSVYFSAFAQLEAMFLFGNEHKTSKDIHKVKSFFENKAFTIISLSPETIQICYDLYEEHTINHPQKDIIHVASAMQSNCKYLVTLDKIFINTMQSVKGENIPRVLNPNDLKSALGILPLGY